MADVPIRKIRETVYVSSPQWVASENFTNMTFQIADPGNITPNNMGRMIIPSGTPYPANDGTCIGLTFNDVDVSAGSAEVAVMLSGFVYEDQLPVQLTAQATQALNAKIIPRNGKWANEARSANQMSK